jgi:AcrR family transcriptional regulator
MIAKINTTQTDTKKRILDTAEALFARNGYRGTSLRAITGKANVNLASVNYHFGSKKALLEEVIKRRMLPLNKIRRKKLERVRDDARTKGKQPDIKAVLTAFIEPTILFRESEPGAKDFVTFIGRSFADPDDTVRRVFHQIVSPMAQLLFDTVSEALPDQPRDLIFWRLHFTMGALFHTMHICGNIKPGFMNMSTDIDAVSLVKVIIPYVTAGMKAR